MTADGFKRAAAALFGDQWTVPEMADSLEVGIRSVQQWESGEADLGTGIIEDIAALLRGRRALIDELLLQIK